MLKKIREFFDAAKARQENERLYLEASQLLSKADRNNRLYLALLRETRSLNRTVRRQGNTIRRLRAKLALEAPTTLPPLAQSPEGRALYNHAYQQGRRKGRKDVLEAIDKEGESMPPIVDDKAFDIDAAGLSSEPPKAALEAVERIKDAKYVDTSVPTFPVNDEVMVEEGQRRAQLAVVRNEEEHDHDTRPGS